MVELLARLGYMAKGVIWRMIGMLAAGVAFGVGGVLAFSHGVWLVGAAGTVIVIVAAGLVAHERR